MRGQGAAARGSGLGVGWPSLPQPPLGRAPSRCPHSCSWRPRGTSRGPRLRPDLAEVDEPFALPGLTTTSDTSGTMLHCIRQPLANRRQHAPLKQHRLQAAGSQDHVGLRPRVERPAAWVDRPLEAPAVASETTRATHGCGRLRSPQRPWGPPGGAKGQPPSLGWRTEAPSPVLKCSLFSEKPFQVNQPEEAEGGTRKTSV